MARKFEVLKFAGIIATSTETETNSTTITIDTTGGWGFLCLSLINKACKMAGRQDLIAPIHDLLTAEKSTYTITEVERR